MSNNNNGQQQQQRNLISGASIAVGAIGVLAGLAAAEHAHAQEENRESIVQGFGRWFRENLLDMPSSPAGNSAGTRGTGSSVHTTPRRLSPAEINILPIRQIDKVPTRDNEAEQTGANCDDEKAFCVVCREQYEDGDILMRLPCFHEFHAECIREYLETCEGPVCPICRHPVTVQY